MLRGPNGRPKYTVGMDEISAPIRIRIFVFNCCATRIGAATDRERIAQQRKRPVTEAASFIFSEELPHQTGSPSRQPSRYAQSAKAAGSRQPSSMRRFANALPNQNDQSRQ